MRRRSCALEDSRRLIPGSGARGDTVCGSQSKGRASHRGPQAASPLRLPRRYTPPPPAMHTAQRSSPRRSLGVWRRWGLSGARGLERGVAPPSAAVPSARGRDATLHHAVRPSPRASRRTTPLGPRRDASCLRASRYRNATRPNTAWGWRRRVEGVASRVPSRAGPGGALRPASGQNPALGGASAVAVSRGLRDGLN